MSLTNVITKTTLQGTGSTTSFLIPFDIIEDASSEVKVYRRDETIPTAITETLLTEGAGSDYTLTGAVPPATPFPTTVEFNTAPLATYKILIIRELTVTQLVDFLETSEFPVETNETALDRMAALLQQMQEQLTRSPLLTKSTQNVQMDLPEPVSETFWGWNTGGTNLKYYTAEEVTALADPTILHTTDIKTVTNKTMDGGSNTLTGLLGTNVVITPSGNQSSATAQAAIDELQTDIDTREVASNKGTASGYASLDGSAKVPIGQLPDSVVGSVQYQGTWNAATNMPTLSDGSGTKGQYYVVSVSGSTTIDGLSNWNAKDWIISNDTPVWEQVDNTESVVSVAGKTGVVTLDTDDVSEAANLYYTEARVDANTNVAANTAKVSAGGSIDTHSDVDVTTSSPTAGQALKFNGTSSKWEPFDDAPSGLNYILNPGGESGTGYVTVTAGISKSVNSSTPIRGSQSTRLTIASSAITSDTGDFEMKAIDLADTEGSQSLPISFLYKTSGVFATDDVQFVLRDKTNNVDIPISDVNETEGKIWDSSTVNKFVGKAELDPTSSSYALRMKVLVSPSADSIIDFDDVFFGPDVIVPGSIITEPQDFTPSFTNFILGNGTVDIANWHREGSFMLGSVNVTLGSTSSMGTGPELTLPGSELINSNFSGISETTVVGHGAILDTGAARFDLIAVVASTTNIVLRVLDTVTSHTRQASITSSVPFTWATGDEFDFSFKIPISGWSAGALQSTTETLFSTSKLRRSTDTALSIPTSILTPVDFDINSSTFDYDKYSLWRAGSGYNSGTGTWTVDPAFIAPFGGEYEFKVNLLFTNVAWTVGEIAQVQIFVNGTSLALLDRYEMVANSSPFVPLAGATTLLLIKGDVVTIRAQQTTGANLTLTGSNIFNFISIKRAADFSSFSVFNQTQTVEIQGAPFSFPAWAAGTWIDISNFDLLPGEWDVLVTSAHRIVGVTPGAASDLYTHIHTVAGNNAGSLIYGENAALTVYGNATFQNMTNVFKTKIVVTQTTTYYLKHKTDIVPTASSLRHMWYKVFARRIK